MNKLLFLCIVFFNFAYCEEPPLLDDSQEMQEYIASFPYHLYKIYNVPGQGKFYIDQIDDGIKSILRRGIVWEQNIIDLMKKYILPNTVVIDIGAHIGTHTITMANVVGPNGFVWAFEPQKKIFRELFFNCRLNQVEKRVNTLRYAIGDRHCIVQMEPSVRGNEGGTPLGSGGDLVEMRTLDSFGLKNVSLIKLDAEASEDLVLDGAKNTLLQNRPVIIIEIQGGWTYATAPLEIRQRIDHTRAKLVGLGYKVYHISHHDYLAIPTKHKPS